MRLRSAAASLIVFVAYACSTTAPPQVTPEVMHGLASWYGEEFAGRTTANGEIFDPLQYTAAHRTLPFGTVLDVTNRKTSQTVRVRINDRGPYIGQRVIDLSYAAAQQIGLIEPGTGEVDIKVVSVGRGDREPPMPYEVKINETKERVVIASSDPPRVEFPLPSGRPATPAPAPAASEDSSFRVEVIQETRKQVAPDGRTIQQVPISGGPIIAQPAAPAAATPREPIRVRVEPRQLQYIVQVGAFSVEANARALQTQLAKIGQTSFIDREDLYRVRIGPFPSRDQAVRVRTALESSGMSAIIVAQ